MKNTLDLNRLGKVIKRDASNYIHNMSLAMLILLSIPFVNWLFGWLISRNGFTGTFNRIVIITILGIITLMIAPARLYGNCNDSRKGIGYAMLPISALEKFISMVFYCIIVTPILYMVCAFCLDTILALIGGHYVGYAAANVFDFFIGMYNGSIFFANISPTFLILFILMNFFFISNVFTFGNVLFTGRKTGKTFGFLVLAIITFIFVFNIIVTCYCPKLSANDLLLLGLHSAFYAEFLASVILLWGTYRKIKTQKY